MQIQSRSKKTESEQISTSENKQKSEQNQKE